MAEELGRELVTIAAVVETILEHVRPLATERVRLAGALGRVLRADVVARDTIPPFDNSAMDGFAVRETDLAGASAASPVRLSVQGVIAAGDPADKPLDAGKCFRIMTGAPVPPGAEAVVPHELTECDASSATFSEPVRRGRHIRPAGGDFSPGDLALPAGAPLRAAHLGVAATLGYAELEVTRRLRVAVLCPGDELVEVGAACGPGQIRNSNAYALRGALEDLGAEVLYPGIIPDRRDAVEAAIGAAIASGADAIVSSGGVSAGDFDYVKAVVAEVADPGFVFKVAMRPGKPQVFGLFDGRPLFGLPGNPAASVLSFEMLVRPALRRMLGEREVHPPRFGVRFRSEYRYRPGRVFLLRARVVADDVRPGDAQAGAAAFSIEPPGEQGSGLVASLASANAIVILPDDRDTIHPGEVFPAQWIGGRP